MSTHRPDPPKHSAISRVVVDAEKMLSPRLKWPGGLLAAALTVENKDLIERAALDLNVTVLIVQTDVESPDGISGDVPHFAAYGLEPPEFDYGALLEKFQLLKVEAFAARRAA